MLRRLPIKKLMLLTLFILIMLSGDLLFWPVGGHDETPLPAGSSQASKSDEAKLAITDLDLESFRSRLDERERDPAEGVLPDLPPPTSALPEDWLVITNGTIIDGTGADPIPNGRVVIQGNRIVAVGRAAEVTIPTEAEVIDVTGQTVMPGIINVHVHYACDPAARRRLLVDGVTAVCDLGSNLRCTHNFEREVDWQDRPVARGFRAGPMLTAPGGYPGTFPGVSWDYEVATPVEAEAAVDDLFSRGVDVIKIALEPGHPQHPWPVLSQEQVERIVTTAHAHGLLVRAHVRQTAMLDVALDAGVDGIEHVPLPFCLLEAELKQMFEKDKLRLEALPEFEAQIMRMAAQGVFLTPTLDPNSCAIDKLPGLEPEPCQCTQDFLLETVRHFHQAGGMVVLGNDYGNPGIQSGMPLREMELLLEAGLTPMEVIEASTRHAAYASGHGNELGALESGKLADLIIVDGDPLTDINALSNVVLVIKGGQIVYLAEQT